MEKIYNKIKIFILKLPLKEILVGVLSSTFSAYLIISYTQYKQAETIFVQLRKEIKMSVSTIKTITLDKNLGMPLMLNEQVPNKYWESLTSDNQNLLNDCDPNKNIEKFYTHLNILRTYYDLVARAVTVGQGVSINLAKNINQEQLAAAEVAASAEISSIYCRDRLLPNKIRQIMYKVLKKI